jgi:hypothetical protein
MQLASWSGRRIVLLWIGLLVLISGLVTAVVVRERRTHVDFQERTGRDLLAAPPDRTPSASRDSLAALSFAILRAMNRDSGSISSEISQLGARSRPLSGAERDSLWRALDVPTRLSVAQRDSLKQMAGSLIAPVAGRMLKGIERSMSAAMPWIVAFMVIVYGLPLGLVALTIAWFVARRRNGGSQSEAAA